MDNRTDYGDEIVNLFKSINKKYRTYISTQMVSRQCGEHNFTLPQMMVMHELNRHPDLTLKELSELVGLANSTVCGIVDRLELHGAVVRIRDPKDRRTVRISLSPKVADFVKNLCILKKEFLTGLLEKASATQVENIINGLKTLNQVMEELEKGE